MNDSYVYPSGARSEEQLAVLKEIEASGLCPFCEGELKKHHHKPILFYGKHWLATENQWPYAGTKFHFLVIHRSHVEALSELLPGEMDELGCALNYLTETNNIKFGTVNIRFGAIGKNGATVRHLHIHLIVADDHPELREPVRFKIG